MNSDKLRQWANLIAYIAVVVVNVLANALPINGLTTAEISDRFDVLFVPAGYVFGIWGLIYLALLGFCGYQLLPRQAQDPRLRRLGWLFVVSCLANMVWIFLWHYEQFPLTVVAMIVLLLSLTVAYLRLDVGRVAVSRTERLLVDVPFSIYLGWITVATIANVTVLLSYWGWAGGPIAPAAWAVIMLLVGVFLGAVAAYTRNDVAYLLVLAWAFAGIAVEHDDTYSVSTTAWVATAAVAAMAVWAFYRRLRHPLPE